MAQMEPFKFIVSATGAYRNGTFKFIVLATQIFPSPQFLYFNLRLMALWICTVCGISSAERAEEYVFMTLWDLDGVKTHLMDNLPTMNICIDSCSHQTSLCPGTL